MQKKIFCDTNVFLRYLLGDNSKQSAIVTDLFEDGLLGKVFLFSDDLVFFEIMWVLKKVYGYDKEAISDSLKRILEIDFINFQNRLVLINTVNLFLKTTLSIEDCYHYCFAKDSSASELFTFDKRLKNRFKKELVS